MPGRASDRPQPADGHVAAQLRRAGAIIIGKTNTPEFGTGSHTFNEVYGLTRNPWKLDRYDIQELVDEGEPLSIECDYCGTNYTVELAQLQGLLSAS